MLGVAGDEDGIVEREKRGQMREADTSGFGGVIGRINGRDTGCRAGEERVLDLP